MSDILIPGSKRISFFLGWDPSTMKPVVDKKSGFVVRTMKTIHEMFWILRRIGNPLAGAHDLDIECFAFDANNKLMEIISPNHHREINATGSIFHSSDDETGTGAWFDEEVSLELKKIPAQLEKFILYARNDSKREISEKTNVKYQIMNMTDHVSLLSTVLPFSQEKEKGCVLGILTRQGPDFLFQEIGDYTFNNPDYREEEFFAKYLIA